MKTIVPPLRLFTIASFFLILLTKCGSPQEVSQGEILSLGKVFQEDFAIGAALSKGHVYGEDSSALRLITREFTSITPENIMKSMNIHPAKDEYDFEAPDKFVQLGEQNNMFIVGHTLVWHSQLSDWLGELTDSTEMSNALTNHIQTIVGRYRGRINGWDVVNEALNEDGSLRESVFLKVIGEDYLRQAFVAAAEADPEAELYYNDYNMTKPSKRTGAIKLIKDLQKKGVKVDGVGLQGHWSLLGPSLDEIEESILAYAALDIKVTVTELDITVLPNPWDLEGAEVSQNFEGSPFMNPYPTNLPDSVQIQLAERYEGIFKLFLKHKDKISRVTFWGVEDGHSWLNGWPIKGRTNYPLVFDRQYAPKLAYKYITRLKKDRPMNEASDSKSKNYN